MTHVRGPFRGCLVAWLARAHRRWLHPTSGRQPGASSCRPHRRTAPDAAGRPQVSGTCTPIGRTQRKCPAAATADCRPSTHCRRLATLPDTRHTPLQRRHGGRLR
jgi:hypothetical protein